MPRRLTSGAPLLITQEPDQMRHIDLSTRTIDTSALSYRFIDARSRSVDWSTARREDGEGVTVHLPAITAAILAEYDRAPEAFDVTTWVEDEAADYLSADRKEELARALGLDDTSELGEAIAALPGWKDAADIEDFETAASQIFDADEAERIANALHDAKAEHDETALEEAIDRFQGSDNWFEWQDSFEPAMNFLWPCEPAYRITDEDAATLINQLAGATSLVTLTPPDDSVEDETQGIVLTGGGMDLSWDICAAYICCGCIPPVSLLGDLPLYAGMQRGPMQAAILECLELAAAWMEGRAQRLREHRTRIEHSFNK